MIKLIKLVCLMLPNKIQLLKEIIKYHVRWLMTSLNKFKLLIDLLFM